MIKYITLTTIAVSLLVSVEAAPDSPEDRLAAGAALLMERAYTDAREVYVRIAGDESVPNHFRSLAWSGAGRADYYQGRLTEAAAAFEQALALRGVAAIHLRDAWHGLLNGAWEQGDYAAYRALCERIEAADNADDAVKTRARRSVGRSYEEEGLYPEALEAYLAFIEEQGERFRDFEIVERVDVLFRKQLLKAEALLEAGEFNMARTEYLRVPDMPQVEAHHVGRALLGAAQSLEKQGEPAAARAEYAAVLERSGVHWPDRGRAQMGIARCYEAEGKPAEARAAYQALLEMKNISRFDRAQAEERLQALSPAN